MIQQFNSDMSDDEKLSMLQWLITRYDNLRTAVANRAAMAISGNAILLGGEYFLLKDSFSEAKNCGLHVGYEIYLLTSIESICIVLSMQSALSAISFVWKNWDDYSKISIPFIRARDTITTYKNSSCFVIAFENLTKKDLILYMEQELFVCAQVQFLRYKNLNRALRWLYIAIAIFLASMGIVLAKRF